MGIAIYHYFHPLLTLKILGAKYKKYLETRISIHLNPAYPSNHYDLLPNK